MSIEPEYVMKVGLRKIERVNFPKYFLHTLLSDERFSQFVVASKIPGEEDYKDAAKSSNIGFTLGMLTGFGWQEKTGGVIFFDGCSINHLLLNHAEGWAYMSYGSPLIENTYGNVIIKPKTQGLFGSKRAIDVEIKGDDEKVSGLSGIRKDTKLLNNILLLFRSGIVWYEDHKDKLRSDEIRFTVLKRPLRWFTGRKEAAGIIELGLGTNLKTLRKKNVDYASLCIASFEVIDTMAHYLKPMFANMESG